MEQWEWMREEVEPEVVGLGERQEKAGEEEAVRKGEEEVDDVGDEEMKEVCMNYVCHFKNCCNYKYKSAWPKATVLK